MRKTTTAVKPPRQPRKKAEAGTEEISIDELGDRYLRSYFCDLADGYPERDPENHFRLALLYLTAGRYSHRRGSHGLRYKVPPGSEFSGAEIQRKEELVKLKGGGR